MLVKVSPFQDSPETLTATENETCCPSLNSPKLQVSLISPLASVVMDEGGFVPPSPAGVQRAGIRSKPTAAWVDGCKICSKTTFFGLACPGV